MVVVSGQQYYFGENPTVIMHTADNNGQVMSCHVGTDTLIEAKARSVLDISQVVC